MDKLVQQFKELKVSTASKYADNDPSLKELIETHLKAVLNCTFYYENYLTENNFKLESSTQDVNTIVNLLNAVVSICSSVDRNFFKNSNESSPLVKPLSINFEPSFFYSNPLFSVVKLLGIELAECILWRQGSILYAFCCVKLASDPDWVDNHQIDVLNYLKDGVNYFYTMLNLSNEIASIKTDIDEINKFDINVNQGLRNLVNEQLEKITNNSEVKSINDDNKAFRESFQLCPNQIQDKIKIQFDGDSTEDDHKFDKNFDKSQTGNTLELIEMGIKSDAHLLAMMYCGEMCFWYCKYSLKWQLLNLEDDKEMFIEMKNLGVKFLKIYVKAVEKILRFAGWNCEKAKELLNLFTQF